MWHCLWSNKGLQNHLVIIIEFHGYRIAYLSFCCNRSCFNSHLSFGYLPILFHFDFPEKGRKTGTEVLCQLGGDVGKANTSDLLALRLGRQSWPVPTTRFARRAASTNGSCSTCSRPSTNPRRTRRQQDGWLFGGTQTWLLLANIFHFDLIVV